MNVDLSLNPLLLLLTAAVIVESVVKTVENIKAGQKDWRYWGALVGGLALGVLVAVTYDLDLFKMLGFEAEIPYVGAVLTGLVAGRGSNYIADLFKAIGVRKQ